MALARRRLLLALLCLLLSSAARAAEESVLLISLDGTPPEAVQDAGLETLKRLTERGARGQLVPVFPTNTFPNHVTLVTGVAPDRHGIVNNVFEDPQRGPYRYESDPTWIEVEPLWSLLAQRSIPSAAFHWVGSEGAWRSGRGPRHWRPFDASVAEAEKVEQILAWLDLPDPDARPRLVTSWFRGADRAAHRHGPGSRQVVDTLRAQDRALGRLVRGLEERQLWPTTTLLVVSDHGIAPVERTVDLAQALESAGSRARVWGGGGFATVRLPRGEGVDRVLKTARELGLEAYRPAAAPPELRVSHPRFGDLVVLAPAGTAIASPREGIGRLLPLRLGAPALRGAHGYPPAEPKMHALFVVFGRGVPAGTQLGKVSALSVAPTVLALLGVTPPAWMEERPIPALQVELRSATHRTLAGGETVQ